MIRRNKVGFIFQTFNLIPSLNAVDNVILPMLTDKNVDKDELEARAITLLRKVGLGDRVRHTPNEMSGGERQRVAVARALINEPEIVLADEPTGNLDSTTGKQIFEIMRKLNKEQRTTFVIVTHDTEYIEKGDTVYHIKDGVIAETYRYDGKNHNGMKKSTKKNSRIAE
jgi:putative ABC transport system ATP-binding protein